MSIFSRTLYIYPESDSQAGDIYATVCQLLQSRVAGQFADVEMTDWPNGRCQDQNITVEYDEWKSKTVDSNRLIRVTLRWTSNDLPWEVDVHIAAKGADTVIVTETWRLTTYQPKVRYDQMPELLDFLTAYPCKNEDGYLAGKLYTVSRQRIESFVAFLQSPERRLPVILISPRTTYDRAQTVMPKQLAARLWGLAHVIRLKNNSAVAYLSQMLPAHSCYNGAIRLYWPGFSQDDPPGKHPYKLPSDQDGAVSELFSRLAEASSRLFGRNMEIVDLERQREAEYREEARRSLALARQQIEVEKNIEEYIELYQFLEQEYNEQKQELDDLRSENRSLRWRLNSVWQTPATIDTEEETKPCLWLSGLAAEKYLPFDAGETAYWDRNIFRKLLNRQQRESQSERVKTHGGEPCFIYPRSQSAAGRRVLYYCQDEDVFVCAIFKGNDHDGEYARLRKEGVNREMYTDFQSLDVDEKILHDEEAVYDVAIGLANEWQESQPNSG
jgi:hypothetical protein